MYAKSPKLNLFLHYDVFSLWSQYRYIGNLNFIPNNFGFYSKNEIQIWISFQTTLDFHSKNEFQIWISFKKPIPNLDSIRKTKCKFAFHSKNEMQIWISFRKMKAQFLISSKKLNHKYKIDRQTMNNSKQVMYSEFMVLLNPEILWLTNLMHIDLTAEECHGRHVLEHGPHVHTVSPTASLKSRRSTDPSP